MMTEIWWKVFLAAIITAVIAKALGCTLGIVAIFAYAFIGWTAVIFILLWLFDRPGKGRAKK